MDESFNIVLSMGTERQSLKNRTVVCTLKCTEFFRRVSLLHSFLGCWLIE